MFAEDPVLSPNSSIIYMWIILIVVALVIFLIIFLPIRSSLARKRRPWLRYSEVEIGTAEKDMLNIMGPGYTRSLSSDGSATYRWQYHGTIQIIVKDGLVQEVTADR